MSKAKNNRPTTRFWLVLGGVNVLAMSYPISVFRAVDGGDGQLFASLVLLGILFVLGIADSVGILLAYCL